MNELSIKQPVPLAGGIDPLVFEKIGSGEQPWPIGEQEDLRRAQCFRVLLVRGDDVRDALAAWCDGQQSEIGKAVELGMQIFAVGRAVGEKFSQEACL